MGVGGGGGGGKEDGWVGEAFIKLKLCLFAIYSCIMEKKGIHVIFHFPPISH